MDTTARLWDIVNGTERATLAVSNDNFIILIINYYLQGHSGEVISLCFDSSGDTLLTGSFDHTVFVWDVPTAK